MVVIKFRHIITRLFPARGCPEEGGWWSSFEGLEGEDEDEDGTGAEAVPSEELREPRLDLECSVHTGSENTRIRTKS